MSETLKLGIVGSRTFDDYERLCRCIEKFNKQTGNQRPLEIVSGGAKGADSLAERYAKDNGLALKVFYPKCGPNASRDEFRAAAFARNAEIVGYSEKVIAFWDMSSNGTRNTIKLAKAAHKLYGVVDVSQPPKAKPGEAK